MKYLDSSYLRIKIKYNKMFLQLKDDSLGQDTAERIKLGCWTDEQYFPSYEEISEAKTMGKKQRKS